MQAIEFVVDPVTKEPATELTARLHDEAKRRGLLVGKAGLNANVFRLSPPLIISKADVDEAIGILDESLTAVA
jgi:4-aminobutyrate aminotransferase